MGVIVRFSLLVAFAAGLVGTAAAFGGPTAPRGVGGSQGSAGAFAAALAAPNTGDVSYGMAEVRIASRSALAPPRAAQTGQLIFAQRIGGLAIIGRSEAWSRLRASTRVFVVVSRVSGAARSLRQVAFFVIRRRTGARTPAASRGEVVFSIANARPAFGSFWVRGVGRRGFATIFTVRDMLATAVGNWSRYLAALRVAHALLAAMHPLELGSRVTVAARAVRAGRTQSMLWAGGQRPSARVHAIFRLLADAAGDPLQFAQAKRNPLILGFIAHELNNLPLAKRWRAVTTLLPAHVPDRYAAAAHVEAQFTHVVPPRIAASEVAVADGTNSAVQFEKNLQSNASILTVQLLGFAGGIPGSVTGSTSVYGQNIVCPPPDPSVPCTASFLTGQVRETLTATAAPGWQLFAWHGCDQVSAGTCRVLVGGGDRTVGAEFHILTGTLVIAVNSPANPNVDGPGTVTVQPGAESCQSTCVFQFSTGEHLTLTATPNPGASFLGWGGNEKVVGCESTAGNVCTTTMPADLNVFVEALFDGPAVSLKKSGTGAGTVTSNPVGIDCGPSCPAQYAFFPINGARVTLTAIPAPGSSFAGWNGCDSSSNNTCVTATAVDSAHDVTAQFTAGAASTMIRIAGTGTQCPVSLECGNGGSALNAQLSFPAGVALDRAGNLYIADTGDQEIREVGPDGTITPIAGNGTICSTATCGDGGQATTAELDNPQSVTVDRFGALYIADTSDQTIRKVDNTGAISTIAGRHGFSCQHPPDCGDNGQATHAALDQPLGAAVDAGGNLYIADAGDNEVRKVTPDGVITRFAGTGTQCTTAPTCGDGGPATSASLSSPSGVAVDPTGNVYIADTGDNEVRKVTPDGTISRFAGDGRACTVAPACTNGPVATNAQLNQPLAVAVGPQGGASPDVYIADTGDDLVRAVDPFGQINQVAGTGLRCMTAPDCGDGGPATSAQLDDPSSIAVDATGNVDIADTQNHEIRQAQVRQPL